MYYMDKRLNSGSLKEKTEGFKNAAKRKMMAAKAGRIKVHLHDNFKEGFLDIALIV